ncbi:MAG TPA: hypothetical protein VH165_18400 [Kofleriaceae bacterium]|nr:hypothetical protein [Kofleriaceae bacterium]
MTARRAVALGVALAVAGGGTGCGNDRAAPPRDAGTDGSPLAACAADPPAFVRHALLALAGRRPRSQDEVEVYADLFRAAQAAGGDPRRTVARAIAQRPELVERWVDALIEALRVQRSDIQSELGCWGQAVRDPAMPDPGLAAAVRDAPATGAGDGAPFTLLDLARSAVVLDDVTPVYRAQLFSMIAHPIPAANVDPVTADLARRADVGATFDAAYLHRDATCLACHTSDASVTDSDDPALDRFWPVAGAPEDTALESPVTAATASRAHAAFRVLGVLGAGTTRPWGWTLDCGQFATTVGDDIAGAGTGAGTEIDAKLGSVTGTRATVFDVEAALHRGFTALRTAVPAPGADGPIADPDAALAWLVALKITEDVFRQATGASLTIANYFPRNRASRDLLAGLAAAFVTSGYSLKALLAAIAASDYFARQAPDAMCGDSPYSYPDVFDPWAIGDADPALRGNGPGDAVMPLDAKTLVSAAAGALEWTPAFGAARFPTGDEATFELGIGAFLRNSEPGFRGLDFQARLRWEAAYATCARPAGVAADFIDRLLAAGAADPAATTADLVQALKDRLIGEPAIADGAEHDALVALVGPLDAPAAGASDAALRSVCGALLDAPQFLLQGVAGRGAPDPGAAPRLTPASASYAAVCGELAATGVGDPALVVRCGDRALALGATAR